MPVPPSVEAIKNEGNELFRRARFAAAADKYTECIVMVAGAADQRGFLAILYCNRAMARRSLAPADIDAWRTDAQLALEADRTNPKGHYLVGLADVATSEFGAGVRHLEEGLEMAKRQKKPPSLLREFETAIAVGRWKWHQHTEQADREQDFALRSYLDAAIGGLRDLELQRAMLDHHAAAASPGAAAAGGARGGAATCATAPPAPSLPRSASDRYTASCSGSADREAGAGPSGARSTAASPVAGSGTATASADDDDALFGMAGDSAAGSGSGSRPTTAAARAAAARAAYASVPSTAAAAASAAPVPAGDTDAAAAVLEASVASIEQHHAERSKQVTALFDEREKERAARSVPDHFLCSITLDLMLDPVLAPSGVSYEAAAIRHYLTTVKHEDPTTRKPLTADQLYPNLALKSAIQAWLAVNPWAHPLLPTDGSA